MKSFALLVSVSLVMLWGSAPASANEEERQMLVIPLSGKLRGKLRKAPRRLSKAVSKAAGTSGAMLITARVGRAEIAAITGCRADSTTCYDEIATTIGVQEIVFGSVRKGSGKSRMIVEVTWVRTGRPAKTIEIPLRSRRPRAAAKELERKLADFFVVKKPAPPVAPPAPVVVPKPTKKKKQKAGFSLSRVKNSSWGVLGGGVAAAGLGLIFLSVASSRQGDIDDAPTDSLADLQRLADLESSAKRNKLLGSSLLVLGLAGTVVGGVLVYRQGSRTPRDRPRVQVSPIFMRDGGGVAVSLPWDL